jgi:hypothetical protein
MYLDALSKKKNGTIIIPKTTLGELMALVREGTPVSPRTW